LQRLPFVSCRIAPVSLFTQTVMEESVVEATTVPPAAESTMAATMAIRLAASEVNFW
jgi:hypothetical protein